MAHKWSVNEDELGFVVKNYNPNHIGKTGFKNISDYNRYKEIDAKPVSKLSIGNQYVKIWNMICNIAAGTGDNGKEQMIMENTEEMNYYPPKLKNIFLLIMALVFAGFGVLLLFVAYNEGDYGMSILGAALGIFFIVLFVMGLNRLWNPGPYLTLTREELIINASAKNPIHIAWEDIKGFSIYKKSYNKFLGVILYDEEKYRAQMTSKMRKFYAMNSVMNMPLYNIAYGQVKRRDRDYLLQELDVRVRRDTKENESL